MARRARACVALLCICPPFFAGCVCDGRSAPKPEPKRSSELASWEFARVEGPASYELWPAPQGGPTRHQRHVVAHAQGVELVVTTVGRDPNLSWAFETPLRAAVLALELDSDRAGTLQLFFTSPECKVFEERCSIAQELRTGNQRVEFVLDPEQPLHGVRVDFPETPGTNLVLRRVRFGDRPELRALPSALEEHTQVSVTRDGLDVKAGSSDPWLAFPTPWLVNADVGAVEVELGAPPGALPQLYWQSAGAVGFSEASQTRLTPVPGRPDTFVASLAGVAGFRGPIRALRLDPGEAPGSYVLRRITLLRPSGK